MISEVISGVFEGAVKPILDKFVPDAQERLEAEQLFFKQAHELNMGQVEINKIEAASADLFVAGWRPFIGWVCGATFAYAVIIRDLLVWGVNMYSVYRGVAIPVPPAVDSTLTLEVLFALLGFGGLRTYEKSKGLTK
ncbi:MAG: 3TM-type holin [Cetobacterium sp.]